MNNEVQPNIILPENALVEGYSVELGGYRYSDVQWEQLQTYFMNVAWQQHFAQLQNAQFHKAFGIETPATPQAIPAEDVPVVIELIREEFIDELIPALGFKVTFTNDGKIDTIERVAEPKVQEIYDAFIDILYVTYGGMNRAGMDAAPGYNEVQASNMSKLGEDGKPIIAGENDPDGIFPGRVKKGPNYFKPDLYRVLREQGWQG